MKNLSLTIGIPAFNEEKNIGRLIKSLLEQKQNGFVLKEIIVVSDQSTDKTEKIVKGFKKKNIKLISNKIRLGQALSQNKILDKFHGDILVLLNGDVLPTNNSTLLELIRPIIKNPEVGLVSGDLIPLKGKTLIENILNYSVDMKREIYEKINNQDTLLLCRGPMRAFSKNFASEFRWEATSREDAFSYLSCKSKGFKFVYNAKASCYFRSPDNLTDHLKQSTRFLQVDKNQQIFFDKDLVKKSYEIPKGIALKIALRYSLSNPFYFLEFLLILIFAKYKSIFGQKQTAKWTVAISSKNL